MTADVTKSLVDHLSDDTKFTPVMEYFIARSTEDFSDEERESGFAEYFSGWLDAISRETAAEITRKAQSPIEKIFLNSLLLHFISTDGLGLAVHPTFNDARDEIAQFREQLRLFNDFLTWFDEHKPTASVEEFLDREVERGALPEEEREHLQRMVCRYRYLPLTDGYHMTLQPKFLNILPNGRSIRADILFWKPTDPSINIIVECDGFAFHSSKAKFVSDRQRDRCLKALGYEVLRFSGAEINARPQDISDELATYLKSRAKPAHIEES